MRIIRLFLVYYFDIYMKKNVVILSTMYYPDMGAPSACLDKYVHQLKDQYNFYIITKTYVYGIKSDGRVYYISNWMHKLTLKCNDCIQHSVCVCINKLILKFIGAYKLIINQFSYPFFNSWEIKEYYNQLEGLSKKINIDVVIAVSNTWTCQFAAINYKRMHPSVKWVAFILDPFSESHIYYKYKFLKKLWKKCNVKNEGIIYNEADVLLFSDEMYKFALKRFKVSPQKSYNLSFALEDIRKGKQPQPINSNGPIKLIYAGMFYQKIRNPEFMLSTLSKIKNIKLDLFVGRGECEKILDSYISDNVTRTDFVNRGRYEEMICNEYDILVNVGNISTLQAPSKMLELLSSGRPILNFYFEKDYQYYMIEQYPLGLNIGFHEKDAVQKTSIFCEKMRGKCMLFDDILKLYPDFALSKKVSILKSVIDN